ncbi:MAG TPA: cob(I)yrinic acid a,c-diamide adenosyltransferase, partial [Candidatus Limnocylindria bacterium]|nr:cob(I)yrinic acid a,c-diamide adenosyltransferase [Candidatus Limnocylindria bacterium]
EERLERERARVAGAATLLEARVHELMPDLLVLDEACVALAVRMLSREDAERLIEAGLRYGDVVLTGRDAPQWLLDRAAYVTRMEAVKHPFDEGRPARKGIEF